MQQARLLSIALHNPRLEDDRAEKHLENILQLLDLAAEYDPDFVCFPEVALGHAARQDGLLDEAAETVPGPATEVVGEKARALDSYVVLPLYERDDGDFYNSAVLIDPAGEVSGVYRKVAPVGSEVDGGITPGEEIPVFETSFGRVGIFICWDIKYPEVGAALAREGADLVFHPTHGSGHHRCQNWAEYYGYQVVFCDKHGARVFDPVGIDVGANSNKWNLPTVDADLHGGKARLAFAEVNVDTRTYTKRPILADILEAYPGDIVMHERSSEGIVVLESISESVSLDDLEREFDELEQARDYEERMRQKVLEAADDSPLLD
ncbi:carbon-nitrogen hydrolase family protein [Haloarchaeobius sp. TZWSO28]|uniref:carbon-nitrogen hydrolase family protein n=1 Tax=Haloarchaeobius sp. TZWSO28 TaxID=3446119 RepID=UPI003EBDB1D3